MYITSREACARLGIHVNTLRRWADAGRVPHYRTESGQRRYDVETYLGAKAKAAVVCYCRVSSYAQRHALEQQVEFMQGRYPGAEIVRDIGSGLNNKRKGLKSILGRVLQHEKLSIVVAHKDRFARFGFELYRWIIEQCGSELLVLDDSLREPERELVEDLLSIVHVFSCRLYGLRNYQGKAPEDAANKGAKDVAEQVVRDLSLCLQRNDLATESSDRDTAELHGDKEVADSRAGL